MEHPPRRHIPILMEDPKDQQLAWALLRQPWFARNFFELGLEEIRDVGEGIDVRTQVPWICFGMMTKGWLLLAR